MARPMHVGGKAPARGRLFIPCAIVFYSGFCIMMIELVASRLVAGYIGMSLYIWTSVIGVILAGISLGNALGGRLADRFESKRLVAVLFALSALASLSTLWTVHWIGAATDGWLSNEPLGFLPAFLGDWRLSPWSLRVLVVVFGSFFLPGTAIGTVTPAIAKWALDYGFATGGTVGSVYAWNNVGSIIGTFVTGYLLLARFEHARVVWLAGAGLGLAAVLFLPAILVDLFRGAVLTDRPAAPPKPADEQPSASLVIPGLLVFASGFCVMMVEIVVSRLVAGHIGQSLYTWTSVIGVILAGISLGNYLGGRLADRFESKRLVGILFLISSPMCLSILQSHHIVSNATSGWMGGALKEWLGESGGGYLGMAARFLLGDGAEWGIMVFTTVFAAFFLPAMVLGTISPAVVKWALDHGYATGRTVGSVYAWNTVGSIFGTFATGFFLISIFYVNRLVAASSLVLALVALAFVVVAPSFVRIVATLVWLLIVTPFTVFAIMPTATFEATVLACWPVPDPALTADEKKSLTKSLEDLQEELRAEEPAHRRLRELLPGLLQRVKGEDKSENETETLADRMGVQLQSLLAELKNQRATEPDLRRHLRSIQHEYRTSVGKRERDRLKFAAALVGRDEEVNVWDQYGYVESFTDYEESNYYTLQVSEDSVRSNLLDDYELDAEGKPALDGEGRRIVKRHLIRQLVLDALVHGYVSLDDYKYLHYEYEHIYASISHRLLRKHQQEKQDLRVLFLGGGSYTFPRYLTEYYADIQCDVAEIDPKVTATVQRSLGMNRARGKRIYLLTTPEMAEPAPVVAQTLRQRLGLIAAAFRRPANDPVELRRLYERRIEQAAAFRTLELDKTVDYVLDLRPEGGAASEILERARELGIAVITPQQFDALHRESSHPNVVTHHMDARQFIMRQARAAAEPGFPKYDVIYGDAFNDFSVPAHLTTVEFNQQMAALLKDDGIFMANIIDIWQVSKFMGAYYNTLRQVFKHTYLFATDEDPGRSRSTFVLICSNQPVDLAELGQREGDIRGLVGALMEGDLLRPVERGGARVIGATRLVGNGQATTFTLRRACSDVRVQLSYELKESEFKIADGRLEVNAPLAENAEIEVTLLEWPKTRRARFRVEEDETSFDLPAAQVSAAVTVHHVLANGAYTLENGTNLRLHSAPPSGARLRVRMYGAEPIVLSDDFCPVDNMLAKVAATRLD